VVHLQQLPGRPTTDDSLDSSDVEELPDPGEILDIGGQGKVVIAVVLLLELV
jgi:hypothetical protein